MYNTINGSAHPLAAKEMQIVAVPEDERVWVPQAEGVWFRPLLLNTAQRQWCNLLRGRRAGILSCHLHPAPVHGYVIKGRWHYREHDWVVETGSYVFEPPSEIHTLTVPDDVEDRPDRGRCTGGFREPPADRPARNPNGSRHARGAFGER